MYYNSISETNSSSTWDAVSKRVYWDRKVSLDRWKDRISIGHRSYLPDAITTMTPVEFIRFYGLSDFRRDWLAIRAKLQGDARKCAVMFDLAWSQVQRETTCVV